jgi:branched-chain amino acid transport system substrate-binding protein
MGQPIEIIIGDHGNKADLGALLARKWFDEQSVDVIADVANSGVGLAVVALASPRNRIVLNNSAASEFTGKACSATSVQWSYNSDASATALATALMKRGLDSLYMISADYAYGRTITTELKTLMQQSGGKVVGEVFHPLDTSEFSSFLLQAQGSGAKAVGVGKLRQHNGGAYQAGGRVPDRE